jgi:hypothetical protein
MKTAGQDDGRGQRVDASDFLLAAPGCAEEQKGSVPTRSVREHGLLRVPDLARGAQELDDPIDPAKACGRYLLMVSIR